MATLSDLLTFNLPMGKTHQQLGIENPVAKFATDPFVLAGLLGGGLSAASMGRKMAHNKGVRRRLAAGFMPKEAAENTVLKGRPLSEALDPDSYKAMGGMAVEDTGKPMRMYHGTQTPFGRVNRESVDAVPENLVGPGHYQSSSGEMVGEGYALGKNARGPSEGREYAPNVRMSYVDTRNPFDLEKTYHQGDPRISPELARFLEPVFENQRATSRMELDDAYQLAVRRADKLESMRRMTERKSDTELLDDITAAMEAQSQNMPISEHPRYQRGADWVALKNAMEDPLAQGVGLTGDVDLAESLAGDIDEMLFTVGDLTKPAQMARRQDIQAMLPNLRRKIRELGDEIYAKKLPRPGALIPKVGRLKGREIFGRIRSGIAGAASAPQRGNASASERSLLDLLQGARASGYATSESGMDLEMTREALRRSGFDSITHLGGANSEVPPHLVNVAWDPEQVYLPYVADEFRSQRPEAAGGLLSALLGGTGVARQSRREQ